MVIPMVDNVYCTQGHYVIHCMIVVGIEIHTTRTQYLFEYTYALAKTLFEALSVANSTYTMNTI